MIKKIKKLIIKNMFDSDIFISLIENIIFINIIVKIITYNFHNQYTIFISYCYNIISVCHGVYRFNKIDKQIKTNRNNILIFSNRINSFEHRFNKIDKEFNKMEDRIAILEYSNCKFTK